MRGPERGTGDSTGQNGHRERQSGVHDRCDDYVDQGCQPIPVELHSVYESGPFTRCTICDCLLHSGRGPGHETIQFSAAPPVVGPTRERARPETRSRTDGDVLDRTISEGTVPEGTVPEASASGDHTDSGADGHAVYEIQKVFRGPEVMFEMAICRRCGEQVAREFSEESIEAMKGFLLSNFTPDDEASRCHFCGLPRALLDGWTMVGACRNDFLIFPPIILCEPCSENLQQRLSRKTRDVQDEFVRDHFPGVPADLDFSPSVFGV